ncbi:MAG TPA: hybrid sensor histidine kinase/response regulator [Desulfosporosinus sp.]|nr:hybrid sensor histidine kinase/response regulator [Desulfosporosinus sp.]
MSDEEKDWDKQLLTELRGSSKYNEQLEEQLSFASALNLIAKTILSNDATLNILRSMVEIVGSTLCVDRSLIYKVDFTKRQIIDQCEWLNLQTPNVISFRDTYSLDVFIDACTYMKTYRHWLETHANDYGPCFSSDGSGAILHETMQIKSALYYPFFFHEQDYYCLTFDQFNEYRIWRKDEIEFIASAADLVEIAIQKIHFIEEQRRQQEALRLSEERFYKVFHYSPVSLSLFSLDREQFIDANECCLKMHGYTRDEFINHSPLDLNLWVDINDRTKFYKELFEQGFAHNHEVKCYKKTGQIFNSLFSGVMIDLNGEKCVVGTKTDISELRQYQRELSHLKSLNLIGEMAAGIAHEIRNPMTTVKGFLQLLSKKKEYECHGDYFSIMVSELDRATSLIAEFLSLAKNKPVDLTKQNLNFVIKSLLPLIQADATIDEKYVELELGKIENVLADGKEIRQLILNLVRNGFEAMSPGGKLTIKTFMINNTVALDIQDQGKGIDFNLIDKIGTPFFTTKDNGTGLGLATCYSIVARHNASMNFNTGTSGTTFNVRFDAC